MKFNEEDLKNKFSALDFDPQNARQNRIYSKLNFETNNRRYAMKKLIYAIGTVCIVGLLLIPVFKKDKTLQQPEIKAPKTTATVTPKTENKAPVFKADAETLKRIEQEKQAALERAKKAEEEAKQRIAKQEAERKALEEEMSSKAIYKERSSYESAKHVDGDYTSAAGAARSSSGISYARKTTSNAKYASRDYYDKSVSRTASRSYYGRSVSSYNSGSVWAYSDADYNSMNAESYKSFDGNAFKFVREEPLSTFSADVDTASYNIVRRDIERGVKPNKDAVRTEEFINYFTYDYAAPKASSKDPVNIITELTDSPWTEDLQVVKIGVKAKDIDKEKLPASNLVFLVDVSGSMASTNRLPLVKKSFAMLVEKLRSQDKVSIVTYANGTNVVLEGVSVADEGGKQRILSAMESLRASGGTNGSAGLDMAYQVAKSHFIKGGNNRIILATDGDFNIGNTSLGGLEKQITDAKESGVFLSVLGFGMGNYKDDKVQTLANKGNGNYAYINDLFEAKKALVKDFGATLFTVAKDVKFQVEFNPAKVQAYRLIGYEKRKLNDRDFNDDTKDAAELGAGHTVTVLYEIVPAGVKLPDGMADIDELKYSVKATPQAVDSDELLTVKLRYKEPDGDKSKLMSEVLKAKDYKTFEKTSEDTRFALSVAAFAELLKDSRYSKDTDLVKVIETARKAKGEDADGYRADFVKLMSLYEALPKENFNAPVQETFVSLTKPVITRRVYNYGYSSCTKTVTVPTSAQAADISYSQAKANFEQLRGIVDKLAESAQRYYASHNKLPQYFEELDTCFNGNVTFVDRNPSWHYKYFDGFPNKGQNLLMNDNGSYYATNQHNTYGVVSPNTQRHDAGKHFCKALTTDSVANEVCQKASGKKNPDTTNVSYAPSSYGLLANTYHETGPAKVIATYYW